MVMRGLTLLLIMLSLATSAAFGDVLIGRHKVRGTTPEGSSYGGKVDISIQGGVYFFRWSLTNGEIYDGRGRLEGDTLTIEWGDTTPVIYKVEPNGVLRGTWGGGKGTDTVTPEKETIAFNKLGEDCEKGGEDADVAIAACTKIIKKNSDPDAYFWRAEAYQTKGDYARALADYDKAIELGPSMPMYYFGRGSMHHNRRDYAKAVADYTKTIELNPDNATTYSYRGDSLMQMGEVDRAFADLDKGVALNPSLYAGYYKRGRAWTTRGDFDKAIADLDRAATLNDKDRWVYHYRGIAHFRKGAFDAALADLSRSIELSGNPLTSYQRGLVYEKKGDSDLAFKDFETALGFYSGYIEALAHRGMIHESRGEKDLAIADYRAALAQSPQEDDERQAQKEALDRLMKLSGAGN